MPIKVKITAQNNLVLKLFNKAMPQNLKENLVALQEKTSPATGLGKVATKTTEIVADNLEKGAARALWSLLAAGINWFNKEEESLTYTDLDYVEEENYWSQNDENIAHLASMIHNLIFQYQKEKMNRWWGSNAKKNAITDHRYLIIALINFINKAITTAADDNNRKQYINFLNQFISAILANEDQYNRDANNPNRLALLKSSADGSSGYWPLSSVLFSVKIALYQHLTNKEKTQVVKQLAQAVKKMPVALYNLIETCDYEILRMSTELVGVPQDFITVASKPHDFIAIANRANYKTILENASYQAYIHQFFLSPRMVANHLNTLHDSLSSQQAKDNLLALIDDTAGDVTTEQVKNCLTCSPNQTFPYLKEQLEPAAAKLARLFSARNKLLKIHFYLQKITNLLDLGGAIALVFAEETIQKLFDTYRATVNELHNARKEFYEFCLAIRAEMTKIQANQNRKYNFFSSWLNSLSPDAIWHHNFQLILGDETEQVFTLVMQGANETAIKLSTVGSTTVLNQEMQHTLNTLSTGIQQVLPINSLSLPFSSNASVIIIQDVTDISLKEKYIAHLEELTVTLQIEGDKRYADLFNEHTKLLGYIETGQMPKEPFTLDIQSIISKSKYHHQANIAALNTTIATQQQTIANLEQDLQNTAIVIAQKQTIADQEKKIVDLEKCLQDKDAIDQSLIAYNLPNAVRKKVATFPPISTTPHKVELLGKSYALLKILQKTFVKFIENYQENGKAHSGIFWARHGETGYYRAERRIQQWIPASQKTIATTFEQLEDLTEEKIINQLASALDGLLEIVKQQIEKKAGGNLHKHSLKTYLIAYYEMLSAMKNNLDDADKINAFWETKFNTDIATTTQSIRNELLQSYFTDKIQVGAALGHKAQRQQKYEEFVPVKKTIFCC